MMRTILGMYITMMPLILGGVANMVFIKSSFYKAHRYPIDGYRVWPDGRRILGDHKTVTGFLSMIVFVMLFQLLWGIVCRVSWIGTMNEWYIRAGKGTAVDLAVGFLTGLAYMLLELPNSFLKRRAGIPDGKTVGGIKGTLFFIVDQIDSLTGVFLVLAVYGGISARKYFGYLFLGAATHVGVNAALRGLKIRKHI